MKCFHKNKKVVRSTRDFRSSLTLVFQKITDNVDDQNQNLIVVEKPIKVKQRRAVHIPTEVTEAVEFKVLHFYISKTSTQPSERGNEPRELNIKITFQRT